MPLRTGATVDGNERGRTAKDRVSLDCAEENGGETGDDKVVSSTPHGRSNAKDPGIVGFRSGFSCDVSRRPRSVGLRRSDWFIHRASRDRGWFPRGTRARLFIPITAEDSRRSLVDPLHALSIRASGFLPLPFWGETVLIPRAILFAPRPFPPDCIPRFSDTDVSVSPWLEKAPLAMAGTFFLVPRRSKHTLQLAARSTTCKTRRSADLRMEGRWRCSKEGLCDAAEETEPVRSVVRGFPEEKQLGERLAKHQHERKGGRSPYPKQSCLTEGMMHPVARRQRMEGNGGDGTRKTVASHRTPSPDSVLAAVSSSQGWSLEGTDPTASETTSTNQREDGPKECMPSRKTDSMHPSSRHSSKPDVVCEGARAAALLAMHGRVALELSQARARARVEAGHAANFTYVGVEGNVCTPQKEGNANALHIAKSNNPSCTPRSTGAMEKDTELQAGATFFRYTWMHPSRVVCVASSAMAALTCINAAVRLVGNNALARN